jgi:hypothetical protein
MTPTPTPAIDQLLAAAAADAERRGHGHVGAEHLLYAIATTRNFGREVLRHVGIVDTVVSCIDELVASESYRTAGSNKVFGETGELIGHMQVDEHGELYLERIPGSG